MQRVYGSVVGIDEESIKSFYKDRFKSKKDIDVDAPVVLCGDEDKNKIYQWTDFEVNNKIKYMNLNKDCRVLEVGCGTGRITKYITEKVDKYIGIDYVSEFIETVKNRKDIYKNDNIKFYNMSLQKLVENEEGIVDYKVNRFIISGGVLMYINNEGVRESLEKLVELLDEKCIIYMSEPVAVEERLTLDKFYSNELSTEYSAIYRTVDEYQDYFSVFYDVGFKLKVSEEFFLDDIKQRKETKQWLFVLER